MNAQVIRMAPLSSAVAVLVGALLAGCGAGAAPVASPAPASPALVVTPSAAVTTPAATPAPTPAATAAATPSPAALTDQALMDELAAIWSSPYDAAKVAALYAPDAVFRDDIAKESSMGLEAIGAKVRKYADLGFKAVNTSAPIRQDNVIAVFQEFGAGTDMSPGLGVVEMKDGRVQSMWEYPAGSSSATAAPASASPAAGADEALMADLNAIWGGTADAARVAALYAPDATFHDTIDGKTYTGLEAIQAKVAANASAGFKCEQGSPAIRQGNVVAVFHRFNAGGPTFPVLAVFELKDGKVIDQWAYPAP
jgi:ketosteroid isomerase-like protein